MCWMIDLLVQEIAKMKYTLTADLVGMWEQLSRLLRTWDVKLNCFDTDMEIFYRLMTVKHMWMLEYGWNLASSSISDRGHAYYVEVEDCLSFT